MSAFTLSTIRQNLSKFNFTDLSIPALVLLIMGMLVVPLPPFLLDVLFTFNIASSVILITAQRLARRLCSSCKAPVEIPREAMLTAGFKESDLDGKWKTYHPVGCSMCNNGYKGRVGIYQVMPVSDAIQRIILRDGSAMDIAEQAELEGVRSLRQSGLSKVKQGLTSLEEVLAVTND